MKKVKMVLTSTFDTDVRVYKEASYLVKKGYDVEILCWDRENEYKDKEVEILEGINIKRFYPYARYGTGLKQVKAFCEFIIECKKYLINEEYEYLHCHDLDGIITGYFARSNDSNLIFDMHEFYEINGNNQKIRYLIRFIVNFMQNKSKYIIYVNDIQTTKIKDSNKKKLIYLPNYPDIKNYKNSFKTYSEKLRVSYIGNVRQYDELKKLMDACNKINKIEIIIHGSGVAYERLKDIRDNYNNVEVTGRYEFAESAKLYSEADILYAVYSTNSLQSKMAYPIKFFESIITKTPIIVSKGTVLEEFVNEHGIGFAVDGDNIHEIRDLIEYINENRNILEEKEKRIEKIQYEYSWDEIVKNLDQAYT